METLTLTLTLLPLTLNPVPVPDPDPDPNPNPNPNPTQVGYPVTDEVNVCAEGGVSKPEKPSTPKKPSAAFYNIHGSTNTGRKGKLTIHANGLWGWTLISFSGGYVVDVKVTGEKGQAIPGTWSETSQAWIINTTSGETSQTEPHYTQLELKGAGPHKRPGGGLGNEKPTQGKTVHIEITVEEGNLIDVNLHFTCIMCDMMCHGPDAASPPPPPPPPLAPGEKFYHPPSPAPYKAPKAGAPSPPGGCDGWSFLGYWGAGEFTEGCRPHEHGTHEHPVAKH